MKTLKIASFLSLFMALGIFCFAQNKTTTIPVSGNCAMCKSKIEKAAKSAGASAANWNNDTKLLSITYNSAATDAAKVQQRVAAAGYDTRDIKASDESYNKLPACCQYDRSASSGKDNHQCSEKCEKKDGKCADMADCKSKGCCKDEEDCKAMACCQTPASHSH